MGVSKILITKLSNKDVLIVLESNQEKKVLLDHFDNAIKKEMGFVGFIDINEDMTIISTSDISTIDFKTSDK